MKSRVSHEDVSNKKFNRSATSGYNTSEVDRYLDDIVEQLKYYEDWYQKYTTLVSNFDALKQKTTEYEGIINKLKTELEELYSNGYSNKVLMQRLVRVESGQRALIETRNYVVEMDRKVDMVVGVVKEIAQILNRVIKK